MPNGRDRDLGPYCRPQLGNVTPRQRIGGDLFFASVGRIGAGLRAAVAAPSEVKRVLLDFDSVDFVDITGGDELLRLVRELQERRISVAFVRVRDPVREDLRRAGNGYRTKQLL